MVLECEGQSNWEICWKRKGDRLSYTSTVKKLAWTDSGSKAKIGISVQQIRNNVLLKFRTVEAALNQEEKEQSISGVVFRGGLSEKWKAELRSEAQLSHNLREFKECHWTSYNKSSWLVWNSRFVFLRSSRIIEVDNVIAERLNAGFSTSPPLFLVTYPPHHGVQKFHLRIRSSGYFIKHHYSPF